jgi:hypothetical protein
MILMSMARPFPTNRFKASSDPIVPEGPLSKPIVAKLNDLGHLTWGDLKGLSSWEVNHLKIRTTWRNALKRYLEYIELRP